MSKELVEIEHSESLLLDFVTYSDKPISVIDLDNADIQDLSFRNKEEKTRREEIIKSFILPEEIFFINRTVSRENQEKLAKALLEKHFTEKKKDHFNSHVCVYIPRILNLRKIQFEMENQMNRLKAEYNRELEYQIYVEAHRSI